MASPTGFLRDPTGGLSGLFASAADALLLAITDLKRTGGGTVWVHRPDCGGIVGDEECPCDPIPLIVDADEPN